VSVNEIEHDGIARVAAGLGVAALDERVFMGQMQRLMRADPAIHQTPPFIWVRTSAAGFCQAVPQQVQGGALSSGIENAVQRSGYGCLGRRRYRRAKQGIFGNEG
jgi:hypothetical protein